MKYFIESNPAFVLLEVGQEEFVFYNSLRHVGARLKKLELMILDLVYIYRDRTYILSKFPERQRGLISDAINAIEEHELLKCDEIEYDATDDIAIPSEYYIHLTYRCNLKCTYCYNKTIRKNPKPDMPVEDWKTIIDKIIPHAKRIVFTGGECLLFHGITDLLKYIKTLKPSITLAAISNGMHDFQVLSKTQIFTYLSELSLSCDSLSCEGQRIGFSPTKFVANVKWIKNNNPNLHLTIASVCTCDNIAEIGKTQKYCEDHQISFDKTILLPESAAEVDLMPHFTDRYMEQEQFQNKTKISRLDKPRFRCGAGKSVCSIDPYGNVFPCQSLHYKDFNMGNLMELDLVSLKYIGKSDFCLKRVDELHVCSKCNVKYICGGGCVASGYTLYEHNIERNHLTCHLNYYNAIEKLKSLDNRL